jgi:hypothetical protein
LKNSGTSLPVFIIFIELTDRRIQVFKNDIMVFAAMPGTYANPSANGAVKAYNRGLTKIALHLFSPQALVTMRAIEFDDITLRDGKL